MSIPSALHDRRYDPLDPTASFAAAAAHLFEAFADVAFDPNMAHAPTVSEAEVAALGAPVAELAPELVARFALRAGSSWGTAEDLRRVAPRALVLAADHALPLDRTVLWERLRAAGWPAWPDHQVEAVARFLRAEWARLVRSEPRPAHAVHRWLPPVSSATHDLSPFLDDWHEALGPLTPPAHQHAAVGHLVALLLDSPLRPDLPDTVADLVAPGEDAAALQLTNWLTGPAIAHQLQQAATELDGTQAGRRTALAVERLGRFTRATATR
ncbi:MAG: hypothetical protein KF703_00485 [Actinobacteria bacterium]|nr:hypothetical protein [Actinomycetota bacterium]